MSVFLFRLTINAHRSVLVAMEANTLEVHVCGPNRPTLAIDVKPGVECKQSLLRYKLNQLLRQYTVRLHAPDMG